MNYNADLSHPEVQYLRFEADKTSGLSNGEKITVSVSVNGDPETFMAKFGKLPKDNEKVYTVSGLSKVVSSSSEIDETCLSAMKQQAEDVFRSYASKWCDLASLTSCEYAGNYFLMSKNWNADSLYWGRTVNRCGIVLKATCHLAENLDSWSNPHDAYDDVIYYVVYFDNIISNGQNGCSVDLNNYKTVEHKIYDDNNYYFSGCFWNLNDLENNCITSNLADYYSENNWIL
jgi:hypothetical protein